MKNKATSILLILSILFSSLTFAFASEPTNTNTGYRMQNLVNLLKNYATGSNSTTSKFKDTSTHWAKDAVTKLTHLGIIGGYPDGTFKPNQNIQVDEFIKLVVTAMGYNPSIGGGYWAEPFIQIAKNEKLIGNNEFSNFRRPITRQEMAKIITNATLSKEEAPEETFIAYLRGQVKDYAKVADTYKQHVLTAYGMGLISGYTDGTFKPVNNATRAEASVVIIRLLDETTRKKIVVNEKDKINLRNNLTGKMITVYPPHSNPEVIRIANALKVAATKSKGYAEPMYSGFSGSIFSNFTEKEEHAYSDNANYFHGSIGIATVDDKIEQEIPYRIDSNNIEAIKKYHNEVIKDVLRALFEKEANKAIAEYEKYLELANTSNKGFSQVVVINDRSMHFFKDGAGKNIGISITKKGVRFNWR